MEYYTATCFSGDCHSCYECIGNERSTPSHLSEEAMRAIDSKKMYGTRLSEITDEYWKRVIKSTIKEGYRNPEEPGQLRKTMMINETVRFDLCDKRGSGEYYCGSPLCLGIYHNAHDYDKRNKYSMIPTYMNKATNVKQCYLCVTNV